MRSNWQMRRGSKPKIYRSIAWALPGLGAAVASFFLLTVGSVVCRVPKQPCWPLEIRGLLDLLMLASVVAFAWALYMDFGRHRYALDIQLWRDGALHDE